MKITPKNGMMHTPQGVFGPGQEVELPDIEAADLISRGFAEPIPPAEVPLEAKPADSTKAAGPRAKQGRPN